VWILLATPQLASALPYDLELENIQPVDAESIEGLPYDPTVPVAQVWMEPIQTTSLTIPGYRTNLDLEVRNNENEWLRLDKLEVAHVGSPLAPLLLEGDDLFGYDSSFFTYGPANPDKRRTAIVNGGFGVSGLLLQRRFSEDDQLPFGRGLGVVAYQPPGAQSAYAVVGSRQFHIGDPPELVTDPYTLAYFGALARYDSSGKLVSSFSFPANRLTEIEELGDGLFLVAGDWEVPGPGGAMQDVAMLSRVRLYDLDEDGGATSIHQITVDQTFGTDGFVNVPFSDGGEQCSVIGTVGLTSLWTSAGTRHVLAADLQCSGQLRAGVALFHSDGSLDTGFGDQGTLVLLGPEDTEVRAVGLDRRRGWGNNNVIAWLGGRTGEGCFDGSGEGCNFGLTRLTLQGQDQAMGWVETTFPEATSAIPLDLVVDGLGRPLMGGYVMVEDTKYAALARFRSNGTLSPGFGTAPNEGLVMTSLAGRQGHLQGLSLASNGDILAATATKHMGVSGDTVAFGAARFASNGAFLWHHDTIDQGSLWQHRILGENFDHGSYLEDDLSGAAEALAEDDQGRILVVGGVASDLLPESWWAGPVSTAVARYLPFGEPESRRWVAPGKTLAFRVPEDRVFPQPPPALVSIRLDYEGGQTLDLQIDRDVQPLYNNAVTSNPAPGGYIFPLPVSQLGFDQAYGVAAHTLHNHHRHSSSSRFAYDLGMGRWDGSQWNGFRATAVDLSVNEAYLVWNVPVRAMADGIVVACRRSAPDNTPGTIAGTPANFVLIQHSFHPFDRTQTEFMTYHHLKQDSIPLGVCPSICPEDDPGCDVATEGVDPDGRELPVPVAVTSGQTIGRVGNSGHTSAPHLHIGLTTGAGGETGDPVAGGIPILFQNVWLANRYDVGGNEIDPVDWFPIHNLALPQSYLVRPGN
jgi:hypothetical protein